MLSLSPRGIFGGAITIELPSKLIDVSTLRQVPDNQEVFLLPDSDASFVLEILERVDASDDEGAAKFHFDSLAHDNSATFQNVMSITLPPVPQSPSPPGTPYPTILLGEQEVQKINHATADQIRILMALYRIESKRVDLVLTANIPRNSGGQRSDGESFQEIERIFHAGAASLNIIHFGLFA